VIDNHMLIHPENEVPNKSGVLVVYDEIFNEYYFRIKKGLIQCINFCPFCGENLPESMRESWFEKLDSLGIQVSILDIEKNDKIPSQFKSREWRLPNLE